MDDSRIPVWRFLSALLFNETKLYADLISLSEGVNKKRPAF